MSETSKDGDRMEGGKRLFLDQSKALDQRLHRSSIFHDFHDRKLHKSTHLIHDY